MDQPSGVSHGASTSNSLIVQGRSAPKEESSEGEGVVKPKRPLSAYNFFFSAERARLLGAKPPSQSERLAQVRKKRRHRKTHGKISFTDLAKHISIKWRSLDSVERATFQAQAEEDLKRYKKEWAEYKDKMNGNKIEKTKNVKYVVLNKCQRAPYTNIFSQGGRTVSLPVSTKKCLVPQQNFPQNSPRRPEKRKRQLLQDEKMDFTFGGFENVAESFTSEYNEELFPFTPEPTFSEYPLKPSIDLEMLYQPDFVGSANGVHEAVADVLQMWQTTEN